MKRAMDIKVLIKRLLFSICVILCPVSAQAAEGCDAGSNIFMKAYCGLVDTGEKMLDKFQEVVDFMLGLCPSSMQVMEDHLTNCWVCTLFYKIFDAINMLSTAVYNQVHEGAISLMAIILAFWLILRIGRMFISFQPPDPMDFWFQTGRVLFRATIAMALLLQTAGVIGWFLVSPLIEGATSFNKAILESYTGIAAFEQSVADVGAVQINENAAEDAWITEVVDYGAALEAMTVPKTAANMDVLVDCNIPNMSEEEAAADGNMFNAQVRASLECMVQGLYKEVAFGLSMASSMICNSWLANSFLILRYPSFGLLFAGLAIWITCFLILFIFTFKIIDATFRLGVFGALLPLLIVAWVFPQSTEYAKTGFKILVRVILTYIVLAIVMALVIIMMMQAFQGADGGENLRQLFLDNNVRAMAKEIEFPSLAFLMAFFCCLLAIQVMQAVDNIASEYAGVDFGANAGSHVGAMAMTGMANIAQGAWNVTKAATVNGLVAHGRNKRAKYLSGAGGSSGSGGRTTGSSHAAHRTSYGGPSSDKRDLFLSSRHAQRGNTNNTTPQGGMTSSASSGGNRYQGGQEKTNPNSMPKTGQGGSAIGFNNRQHGNTTAPKTTPKTGQGGMGMGFGKK